MITLLRYFLFTATPGKHFQNCATTVLLITKELTIQKYLYQAGSVVARVYSLIFDALSIFKRSCTK
jgi:hypothetical protein